MTVTVPIDLDVVGGGLADAIDDDLRAARGAARRSGAAAGDAFGDGFSREVSASAREVDALLAEATRTRTADIDIDIDGMENLASLRESLDLTRQRAEVAALDRALNDVAQLRRAGVDVEGTEAGQAKLATLDRALKAVERRHVVTVDVEVDRDIDFAGVTNAARGSSGVVSTAFSDAFALVGRNAVLLGAVVAAAFATFPVIGAVAATGLVLAFGAGIAGVGILAAAQSERVKEAFSGMSDHIVKEMERISRPLEGTLVSISENITRTFDNLAPTFEHSFAQMAPALTRFSDDFFAAFENLGPAVEPLTTAFTDLLDAIGPKMGDLFTDIADSVTNLSEVISADPELFASLFVGLLGVLPMAINLIADLASTFQIISDLVGGTLSPAFDELKTAFGPLTSLFGQATGGLSLFKIGLGTTVAFVGAVVFAITAVIKTVTGMVGMFRAAGSGIAAAWRAVSAATSSAFSKVRATIANTISRVISVVAGGVARIRSGFSSGFNAARAVVTGAMNSIRAAVANVIARVIGVVAGGLSRVRSAFSSGFNAARSVVTGAMSSIRSAVSSGIARVIGVVAGLPGRIRGALGNLGGMLFSSGYSMISGLADGIRAGIGNAISAASSAVSAVRNFFPFSPAKEGPFSGRGYTTYSGEALVKDFAKSMEETAASVSPRISSALENFTMPSVAARGAGSGSTTTVNNGIDTSGLLAALAAMFAQLQLNVTLGQDRRTMALWYLNGKQIAESLA